MGKEIWEQYEAIQEDNRVDQKMIDQGQSGPDLAKCKKSLMKWWFS